MSPEVHVQGPGLYAKSYREQLKQKNDRIRHVFKYLALWSFPEMAIKKAESWTMLGGSKVGSGQEMEPTGPGGGGWGEGLVRCRMNTGTNLKRLPLASGRKI